MAENCSWPINASESLAFEIYDPNTTTWNEVAGLYIFAHVDEDLWYGSYVGQTDSFYDRLTNHERWEEAVLNGATHVHVKVVDTQTKRDLWESMLIGHLQPPLNTQGR